MNKCVLIGRLTRDPEIRVNNDKTVARFSIAVDRRFKRDGDDQTADFINCVAFSKTAEFVEKYARKGTKFVVEGRIQTGSYTNKDGVRVYTTDIIVEQLEFAESKSSVDSNATGNTANSNATTNTSFMDIPDDISEELPFN